MVEIVSVGGGQTAAVGAGRGRGRRRGAAVAATALVVLTGCTSPFSEPPELVVVTTNGFQPAALTVQAGTEVRWVNQVPGQVTVTSIEMTGAPGGDGATATAWPDTDAATATAGPDTDAATATDDASPAGIDTSPVPPSRPGAGVVGPVGRQFDSGAMQQGDVFALLLDEPGQYVYHSTYQTDLNWVGTITVETP